MMDDQPDESKKRAIRMMTLEERYASSRGLTQAEIEAQFMRHRRESALRNLKSKQALREIDAMEDSSHLEILRKRRLKRS